MHGLPLGLVAFLITIAIRLVLVWHTRREADVPRHDHIEPSLESWRETTAAVEIATLERMLTLTKEDR